MDPYEIGNQLNAELCPYLNAKLLTIHYRLLSFIVK